MVWKKCVMADPAWLEAVNSKFPHWDEHTNGVKPLLRTFIHVLRGFGPQRNVTFRIKVEA